jgi:hypothetical protein
MGCDEDHQLAGDHIGARGSFSSAAEQRLGA